MFKTTKVLMTNKVHLNMMMVMICFINLFIISLQNSFLLKGNMLIIAMFFGYSEIIGHFIGSQLTKLDTIYSHAICVATVLVMSTIIKMFEMSQY